MASGLGKGLTLPLLVVNFCLYFISAALAGSILNRNLDSNAHLNNEVQIGNVVTVVFIPIALIASVVGLASVLAGVYHVRFWRPESLAAASATSLIAWLLTLLAMGLACKEIHKGNGRSKRLKTLEAFVIILSLFELLYLLTLHGGSAVLKGLKSTPATPKTTKDANFGTPAATAV